MPRRDHPAVLVVAESLAASTEAAQNLGLRRWLVPGQAARDGGTFSGIVYVDGWRRSPLRAATVSGAIAFARAAAAPGFTEVEQRTSLAYFRGEALARQAAAVLDAERRARTAQQPRTPTMVTPEHLAALGQAWTLRAPRKRWRRFLDWLRS